MRFVFILLFFSASVANALRPCPDHPLGETGDHIKKYCNETGELVRVEKYFNDLKNISSIQGYHKGKIVNRKVFSLEQVQTQEIDIEHLEDGTFIYTSYSIDPYRAYIRTKTLRRPIDDPHFDSEALEEWVYKVENKKSSFLTAHIRFFPGTKVPSKKTFYSKGGEVEFTEEYLLDNPAAKRKVNVKIIGVIKTDAEGRLIGEYHYEGAYRLEDIYSGQKYPEAKPLSIVVIDSGFETDHPSLSKHWYQNPYEVFDGIDNDDNGVVDDVYGYYQTPDGQSLSSLRESFSFKENDRPVVSHGLHVAGLAVKGLQETSFAGFGGDYTQPAHLSRIKDFIRIHGARFVNMSFSFDNPFGAVRPPRASFDALESLIKASSQSLFFVAAGNKPIDLDEVESYPATYNYDNIVTVGALEASDFQKIPDQSYARIADFSSFGKKEVDIFAPGTDVLGPFIGKSQGRLSGTSMATPNALNVVARLAEEYPQASNSVLFKAMMMGVYIPSLEEPLPCRSGGVIYESRMRQILSLWYQGEDIKEAAFRAREEGPVLEGESLSEEYFKELASFWKNRDIL